MAADDRTRWNQRYRSGDAPVDTKPNRWLTSQTHLVDPLATGRRRDGSTPTSLDIACGAGGTVLWLAERGWHATGVELSDEALRLAKAAAVDRAIADCVTFLHADLDEWRPPAESFDLVTCFYFLDRSLWPALRQAVRPGGMLAMQTHHQGALSVRPHANPAYLLAPGELAALVTGWGWTLLATSSPAGEQTSEAVLARRPIEDPGDPSGNLSSNHTQ